jgi:Holliday junction resolvase RusA-like endonuclease
VIRLLRLPLPLSKNQLHIPIKCGKWHKLVRSKKARIREQEIVQAIWKQIGGKPLNPCFTKPVSVSWTIVFPDRRIRDGANHGEQLFDCLEAAGIVSNDALIVAEHRETMPQPCKPGWVDVTIEEIPE